MLCAVVVLSLGLAHHAPPVVDLAGHFANEYRLPDGSYAELCATPHDNRSHQIVPVCEVCLICASALLPPPEDGHWLLASRQALENNLRQPSAVAEKRAIPAPRSRAPPILT